MVLIFSGLLFLILCVMTFFPAFRLLYARNPPLISMLITFCAGFLGVYMAMELSRSDEREDRMARAATLMEMTRESLATSRMEGRILQQIKGPHTGRADDSTGDTLVKPASLQPRELADLLKNGAVLEQISPQSLKALLASQASMEKELRLLIHKTGSDRRHHLNGYLRELAFAQGVLEAEAEFQRGHIGRRDLTEILAGWTLKKGPAPI